MIIDRKTFFNAIRKPLFPKGMTQKQVDGIEFILSTWERQYQNRTPITQFANVLGTVYLETAATMQPIHEYGDRSYFMRMYDKTGDRPNVAATLGNTQVGDGALFAGMGYVQSTGRANARRNTQKLRALSIIEFLGLAKHAGVLPAHDVLVADANPIVEAFDDRLAAHDTDRTGDRRWLRHDLVGIAGDVITA